MCWGSAAEPGSTPGPGPLAACHSPSLTLFPVTLFSFPINKARKRPKKKKNLKKKTTVGKYVTHSYSCSVLAGTSFIFLLNEWMIFWHLENNTCSPGHVCSTTVPSCCFLTFDLLIFLSVCDLDIVLDHIVISIIFQLIVRLQLK